jgi:hypothetical protein
MTAGSELTLLHCPICMALAVVSSLQGLAMALALAGLLLPPQLSCWRSASPSTAPLPSS